MTTQIQITKSNNTDNSTFISRVNTIDKNTNPFNDKINAVADPHSQFGPVFS